MNDFFDKPVLAGCSTAGEIGPSSGSGACQRYNQAMRIMPAGEAP